MDDLELDRALREALSATPSPEFVARVRTAIAESPRPSIVTAWLKPAAAAACVVLLVIFVRLPREEDQLKPDAQLKLSPTDVALSPTAMAPTRSVVVPTFPPPRGFGEVSPEFARSLRTTADRSAIPPAQSAPPPTRPTIAITSEPPLPEVIVAAHDVEALVRFVSGARDFRFIASFDETPATVPWVMTDLSIAPIAGDTLDPTAVHNN